jgi:hypothetical protein
MVVDGTTTAAILPTCRTAPVGLRLSTAAPLTESTALSFRKEIEATVIDGEETRKQTIIPAALSM